MADLLVKFALSIRKGVNEEADIWHGKEGSPSLIARVIAYLPEDESGRVHPLFSWADAVILESDLTPNSTELTLSKSFPLSLRGAEQARKWLDHQVDQTIEQLRAIQKEFYQLEDISSFDEFIEAKI